MSLFMQVGIGMETKWKDSSVCSRQQDNNIMSPRSRKATVAYITCCLNYTSYLWFQSTSSSNDTGWQYRPQKSRTMTAIRFWSVQAAFLAKRKLYLNGVSRRTKKQTVKILPINGLISFSEESSKISPHPKYCF